MPTYSYRPFARLPARAAALAPVFAGMAVVEAAGAATYPRHRQDTYEVILPLRGPYRCRLNRVAIALAPEQALVVKPGDWHEDLLDPRGRHVGVWFRLALAGEEGEGPSLPLFAVGAPAEAQVVALDPRWTAGCAERLLAEYAAADAVAPSVQQAVLGELFWRLVRALDPAVLCPAFRQRSEDHGFAARLSALFRRHGGGRLDVATMAGELGLSVRRLEELCRAAVRESPARAYAAFRLDRAAELLRATDLPVQEVADRLGFANPFHFARAFRRRHGTTPSAYRG